MTRRLLNVVAAPSLLLCVAVCVWSVRSYWRQDHVGYVFVPRSYETDRVGLTSVNGLMWVGRRRVDNDTRTSPGFYWNVWNSPDPHHWKGITLGWWTLRLIWQDKSGFGEWGAYLPHWFLALVSAAPTALRLLHNRWRPKHGLGRCARCGYDLRATHDRCPECGTEP